VQPAFHSSVQFVSTPDKLPWIAAVDVSSSYDSIAHGVGTDLAILGHWSDGLLRRGGWQSVPGVWRFTVDFWEWIIFCWLPYCTGMYSITSPSMKLCSMHVTMGNVIYICHLSRYQNVSVEACHEIIFWIAKCTAVVSDFEAAQQLPLVLCI